MYPGTQTKMCFFLGGGEGGDFYEDLTPKALSTTLAELWSTPRSNLPTLTIVPVIGATAEPWEAAEGPPLRNLGTGRWTLWQPSWMKRKNG